MCSFDRTEPELIGDVFITPDKMQARQFMLAHRGSLNSADTGAAALSPSPNCDIAISIKSTMIYQRLITYNTHCAEQASMQVVATSGDIVHDSVD